jgi:hypothetical protein
MATLITGYQGVRDLLAGKAGTDTPTDATLRRWVSKGLFPAPRRLGEHGVVWPEEVLLDHLANLPSVEDKPLKRHKARAKRKAKA